MNSVSRIQIQERSLQLKHDINLLLGYFNELDKKDSGYINKKAIKTILKSIEA
jgi:Ca2+-binding EF-hand superfamily protein